MKRAIISSCLFIICFGIFQSCKNPCEGNVAKHYFVEIHKNPSRNIDRYYTHVFGVGKNTEIYPIKSDNSVETYEVYLNFHANVVNFAFQNDTLRDTLTINYTHNSHFVGDKCGYVDDMTLTSDFSNTMNIVDCFLYYPYVNTITGAKASDSVICIKTK